METIKTDPRPRDHLVGRLLLFDALGMKFRELKLRKNPNCPVCGTHPTITKLIDYYEFCGVRAKKLPARPCKCRKSLRANSKPGSIVEMIC